MQTLPGFRDFLPNDCAARNYIFARWREVARRYGFVEWDGPILEPTELYKKKSGPEIVAQLFNFTDKGGREVAMRPELTPTLARVVAAHDREFKKPLKWFSIPQCFRYEKQQRGRLREHFQFNADIVGESSLSSEIELIGLCVDILREFGFGEGDFDVRISHRGAWKDFLSNQGVPFTPESFSEILSIIDKLDRSDVTKSDQQLRALGTSLEQVQRLIHLPEEYFDGFNQMRSELVARGIGRFVRITPGVVRGLTYYTGFVFEVFDSKGKFRAIAGGGRYDNLIQQLSDGAVSLPALGFAMGDVVLAELIAENPAAKKKMKEAIAAQKDLDIYVVIAKEERRADALGQIQALRDRSYRVECSLSAEKVPKQFKNAQALGARIAILVGDEWPDVTIKNLQNSEQERIPNQQLLPHLDTLMKEIRQQNRFVEDL